MSRDKFLAKLPQAVIRWVREEGNWVHKYTWCLADGICRLYLESTDL
jgi:hypothetical protein